MSPQKAVRDAKGFLTDLDYSLQWILKIEDRGKKKECLEGATGKAINNLEHTINQIGDGAETERVREAIQNALGTIRGISGSMSDHIIRVSIRAAHGHLSDVDPDKPEVYKL